MAEHRPPKVTIAGTALVTMLLGFGSGWLLAGRPATAPWVEVPDAVEVTVRCHDGDCTVSARFPDGSTREAALAHRGGSFRCVVNDGDLHCHSVDGRLP